MAQKKSRDNYFDNAKFLLIILVVIGHSISPIIERSDFLYFLYKIIFIFHMPTFIFLVGYFMKYAHDYSDNIIKFILLYLGMQSIYYLLVKYLWVDSIEFTFTTPYWSFWFLLALVAWYAVFPQVKDIKGMLAISFLVGILVGYDHGFESFLSLSRIVVFFPFFLLGYYTKKEFLMCLRNWKKYVILAVCIVIAVIIYKYELLNLELLYGRSSYVDSGYTLWYAGIYRIITYGLSILFGLCFMLFVPTKQIFYSKLGQQTLSVYLMHGFFIKPLEMIGFFNYFETFPMSIMLILLSIVLTYVLSWIAIKLESWLVG